MSRLLIDEYPLTVLPSLAAKIGLNEAIFLQQLHYWLDKTGKLRDKKKWIYNTYQEWEQQFPFWSNKTIRRIVLNLEKQGLLLSTSKYNKMRIDRTKWYTINYKMLAKLEDTPLGQNDHMEEVKMTTPITRDYTKTTDFFEGEHVNYRIEGNCVMPYDMSVLPSDYYKECD